LPSALALVLFAYGLAAFENHFGGGWLHGLKVAAVAVVALAILGMARTLTPDRTRVTLAMAAMTVALVLPSAWGQMQAFCSEDASAGSASRGNPLPISPCCLFPSAGGLALRCLSYSQCCWRVCRSSPR